MFIFCTQENNDNFCYQTLFTTLNTPIFSYFPRFLNPVLAEEQTLEKQMFQKVRGVKAHDLHGPNVSCTHAWCHHTALAQNTIKIQQRSSSGKLKTSDFCPTGLLL